MNISLNKVLYNIEEEFSTFIPLNNEILAISSSNAYKICIIKDGDSCSSGNLILDANGNKCQNDCDNGKIKLMPEGICINKADCDTNYYILNEEETQCGLCSYFYPEAEKYKLINTTIGCISNIPNNADYYNEKIYLLKCKTYYHLDNNDCAPDYCYENCDTCSEISVDINNQKCLSCKSGYVLNNGNCNLELTTIQIKDSTIIFTPKTNPKIETTILEKPTPINTEKRIEPTIPTSIQPEISCQKGTFLSDNKICQNCINSCKEYVKNTCICEKEIYHFYGYYKGINEKINILTTDNLTNIENRILEEIRKKLSNSEINSTYIDSGNYFMVDSPKTKFIISELHATEDLTTIIELGECEDKLKANKSLSQNDSLFVLYIEIDENGMDVPRTEYEIYSKSGDGDLDNVDLDICQDMKINKSVSINITQDEIDKYNSSSGYYNDICYTYTSDNGTDVTLADRRNEYIDNNMAVCEDKCEFIAYDLGTGKAICSCPLVAKVSNISDNKIDIDKLKSNFINFKNIANVKILKCYHLLFSKKIFKNIGCIIISLIIILALGSLFLFYFYGYNLLSHKIKDIVNVKSLETKEDKKEKNDQKIQKEKVGLLYMQIILKKI